MTRDCMLMPRTFSWLAIRAGAQIAAQLAIVISNSPYAKRVGLTPSIDQQQLRGVVLHCGHLRSA